MTNSSNLNDVVGYKVLHFINNEDQKTLGYKTVCRTNTIASHRQNKSSCVMALKISLIHVKGCEKRKPKQTHKLGLNFRSGNSEIVILNSGHLPSYLSRLNE